MSKFRPANHLEDSVQQWIFGSMPWELDSREINATGFADGLHDVFRILKWNGWANYYQLPTPRQIEIADELKGLVTTAMLNTRSSWDGEEYNADGVAMRVRLLIENVARLLNANVPQTV